MSETAPRSEGGHSASNHLSERRKVLNERLLKWGKLFIGGSAVAIAGTLLYPVVAPVGIALGVGGGIVGDVGFIGILGNLAKRLSKKNR